MRAFLCLLIVLALHAAGCRIISSTEVALPVAGPSYRVECNYELNNCLRHAERTCKGRFEQITRKNCPRCGKLVPSHPQINAPVLRSGYRGTLYFHCL